MNHKEDLLNLFIMGMLDYEKQMFLDMLHEDGLLVAAKGLGLDRVFLGFLKVYSDAGNLVLVIGTNNKDEEYLISQLDSDGVKPIPKVITSEYNATERQHVYMEGGVLFVTSRILVVDLLMERVPVDLITGILVYKAHRIMESCQEAFILRLYRQKNKTGFVKAFSSSPVSFMAGFCQVSRIMRNLFVRNLYLWPRFHVTVTSSLQKPTPEVIELHLNMTPAMLTIQTAVLDLINFTTKEIRRLNATLDTDEMTVENAISKSFHKILKLQLDPVWHQLSEKSKQLVSDLKTLRIVLVYLTQDDCVTFYNFITSLQTTEHALKSAGWMLLDSAETLFVQAKLRVFGMPVNEDHSKKRVKRDSDEKEVEEEITEKQETHTKSDLKLEKNPKWFALSEVMAEIKAEVKEKDCSLRSEKVLIVAEDERTCLQLKEYLCSGSDTLLTRLFNKTLSVKFNIEAPVKEKMMRSKKADKGKGKKSKTKSDLTLTQMTRNKKNNEEDDEEDYIQKNMNEAEGSGISSSVEFELLEMLTSPVTIIQPLKDTGDPYNLHRTLEEMEPSYIVMYDADMAFVRQIEVYQATRPSKSVRVYFLMYGGSCEEQAYLTALRKEKQAFEHLIKEKATMVIPENREGRTVDHPDLVRDPRKANETIVANLNTRKGRAVEEHKQQKVIVDMREFRTELPSLIHRRGIDIEPVTLEIGDYILTPNICIERKSISDLIGSLNSGRLYNQAQAMTRYYSKPMLLIEFDQNKPFALQGKYYLSSDMSSQDVTTRLQLLTLHFPNLRILWSPGPYATADLFEELKKNKEEPDASKAAAITIDKTAEFAVDKYNPTIQDFLSKLPGVNSKNLHTLLNKGESLNHLISLSQDELTEMMGNSITAKSLWDVLHKQLKSEDTAPAISGKGSKQKKGFGRGIKRNR